MTIQIYLPVIALCGMSVTYPDVELKEKAVLKGHKNEIVATAISDKGKWAASAEAVTNDVRVWSFPEGKESYVLKAPNDRVVQALAFSPDEKEIAVAYGPMLSRWDLARPGEVRSHKMPKYVSAIAYSPDGTMFAVALGSNVMVLDRKDWKPRHELAHERKGSSRLAFSMDSQSVAAALNDGSVTTWNFRDVNSPHILKASEPPIRSAFAKGNKLLISANLDSSVVVRNLSTSETKTLIKADDELFSCVSVSMESDLAAVSSFQGQLRLWDLKRNQQIAKVDLGECIGSIALCPKGQQVLVGYGDPFNGPSAKANQGKLVILEIRRD